MVKLCLNILVRHSDAPLSGNIHCQKLMLQDVLIYPSNLFQYICRKIEMEILYPSEMFKLLIYNYIWRMHTRTNTSPNHIKYNLDTF